MNWIDGANLTYREASELMRQTREKRRALEDYNRGDAYVNDYTFYNFALQTYFLMLECVQEDLKAQNFIYKHDYITLPKIKDFLTLEHIVKEETADRLPIRQFLEKYRCQCIYEAVEKFFDKLFHEILIES